MGEGFEFWLKIGEVLGVLGVLFDVFSFLCLVNREIYITSFVRYLRMFCFNVVIVRWSRM